MSIVKKIYLVGLFALLTSLAAAQNVDVSLQPASLETISTVDSASKLAVRAIIVKGNKKTKVYMILREIQFKPGDSIAIVKLAETFQLARQQVYNTTLFHEVTINLSMVSAFDIDVIVTVTERWYIFPAPQFQIVDRSLNEWLVKFKGDLSRVNYGVKFVHYNFSGRRDPLRLYLINGYTRNLSFSYAQPYSNRALTQGFGIGGGYSQNREVAYKTSHDNKLLFYNNEDFVRRNIFFNVSLRLQKGILFRHLFNLGYSRSRVNDSILTPVYNPGYFNSTNTSQHLLDLSYTYQYANVNNVLYPLKGKTANLIISKRGLGLSGGTNLFSVEAQYNKYWAHPNNWYSSIQTVANVKLPFEQPYINQRGIGYGAANMRGLEFFVVDGVAFGIVKSTLKKKLISFSIPMPFKSKVVPALPFTLFAKTYADLGYAYNKKKYDTRLNNKLLYTGGFGLDILMLYDINLRIEYSFNQLGQGVFFFESK